MGALGQYVHYHWSNYRKYGTYPKAKETVSNFDPLIFSQHRTKIGKQIWSMQKLESQSLEQFEKNYNTQLDKVNKLLKGLIDHKSHFNNRQFLEELLQAINSKWSTSEVLDYIIKGLDFDQDRQMVIFKTSMPTEKLVIEDQETQKILGSFKRSKGIHIDVLIRLIQQVSARAQQVNTARAQEILKDCKTDLDALMSLKGVAIQLDQETEKRIADFASIKSAKRDYKGGYLQLIEDDKQILGQTLKKFSDYTFELSNKLFIQNRIGAVLAEIIGTVVAEHINAVSNSEIKQALRKFINDGRKTAGSKSTEVWKNAAGDKIGLGSIKVLDFELDDSTIQTMAKDKRFSGAFAKSVSGDNGVTYSIKNFDDSVAQKADFNITLNGEYIGVSMKNTDMSKIRHFEAGMEDLQLSGIALQSGTDLGTYLAAIELQESQLGNHYLQILSRQRGFKTSTQYTAEIQRMRKQANEALSLFLLWSAATGMGMGRGSSDQMAQILAIHDKALASPNDTFRRVRFYSIRDLLLRLIRHGTIKEGGFLDFKDKVIIRPSLLDNQLILWNEYEIESGGITAAQAAQRRIAKLVANARTQSMYIGLSKFYLNSVSGLEWPQE